MDCILCGKCMEVCPLLRATNREELAPRAKALLGDMSGHGEGDVSSVEAARLASLCLGCGRCREKCPQGADVPAVVARLRSEHPDFRSWLWKTWLTRARELWPSTRLAARLIPSRFQPEKLGPLLKMLADVRKGPDIPPFVRVEEFAPTLKGTPVMLFAGCTANYASKRWLKTSRYLLEGVGATLLPSRFECCGGSLRLAGCFPEAERMERKNIAAWRNQGRPAIYTPCVSCQHSLKAYSRDAFEDAGEREKWLAGLRLLSSCLLDSHFSVAENAPENIGYHKPCHLTGEDSDHALLKRFVGERLTHATSKDCCGFGGLLRLAEPELADMAAKSCSVTLAGADVVLTGCSACAARLPAILPETVPAGHWLDVISCE